MSEETNNNRDDVGYDKAWLKALMERDLEAPKKWRPSEVRKLGAAKPKSRIQALLQQFYWELLDGLKKTKIAPDGKIIERPNEDMFDLFYSESNLDEYPQAYKLLQFFNTIARALHITEAEGYGSESTFQKILGDIATRCIEEQEYVETVAAVINEKYPGLASQFRSEPSIEEINAVEEDEYSKKLHKIDKSIESNIDDLEPHLKQIEDAKRTDFEKSAQELDTIVIFGNANWELVIYIIMSPHAPRLIINRLGYRGNIHGLLAGDISTGKSKILKIAKKISPKMVVVDTTTIPTFEGLAPTKQGDPIEEGIIDWAQDGVIIVEELTKKFTDMPLIRRVMDGEYIEIHKKGVSKGKLPNITMFAACNPNDDFFVEETDSNFRKQIAFKEGILSRYDVLIPLTATQVKNEMLVEKIDFMSDDEDDDDFEEYDFDLIRSKLATLATGMRTIKRVVMTLEQRNRVKAAFLQQNKMDMDRRILKQRPLVLLRDLETIARFVNTIGACNFSNRRIENGILCVEDRDVDKAIQLWENLVQFRIQLYARSKRNIMTVADEMALYIWRYQQTPDFEEGVPIREVKTEFVAVRGMIGETTFYKEIKNLRETGRIIQIGKRDSKLKVVVK